MGLQPFLERSRGGRGLARHEHLACEQRVYRKPRLLACRRGDSRACRGKPFEHWRGEPVLRELSGVERCLTRKGREDCVSGGGEEHSRGDGTRHTHSMALRRLLVDAPRLLSLATTPA